MSNAQQSGSLEEIVLTREQLEEIREVQEESKHSRGVGVLLIAYGEEIVPGKWIYFREHSPYVTEFLNIETFRTWIDGLHQFPLKHMKGLVDELGVSDEHLHYVAGRDPFTPTDEELERWSGIKEGIGKLFSHYINLNLGMFARQYLIKESEYVKGRELNPKTVMAGWFSGNCTFPVEHLKGFAEELGVPSDYVKRVTGVDIDEFKVLTWEDR